MPTLSVSVNPATNQISGQGYDANGNTTYVAGSSAGRVLHEILHTFGLRDSQLQRGLGQDPNVDPTDGIGRTLAQDCIH